MSNELFLSEEKATKAMVDAARLAEELRQEQEISQTFEREHKLLDCQVKDLQGRLDEAEIESLKVGKKAMNKLESRIREIESEIGAENRRFADAQKNLRRSEPVPTRKQTAGHVHPAKTPPARSAFCRRAGA